MSSDIQSILQSLVLNNYLCLAGITAVVYDYTLTFSREVEYVWSRPWTWVSTMFVIARYIGLYWIVSAALIGSSFVPGPVEVSKIMFTAWTWAFVVFLSVADLLMILRVYAMWSRSRMILYVLLSIFIIQTVITAILDGIYYNPSTYLSVTIAQVLEFSFCITSYINTPLLPGMYYVPPRLVLGAILTILAVFQTIRQSFRMYRATKQWQPNRYAQQLLRDGILYFIVNVLYQTVDLLDVTGFGLSNSFIFLQSFVSVAFYTLIPRFIISIRELYDRDARGRLHVDTGFGVVSRSCPGLDATLSAVEFAEVSRGLKVEDDMDNLNDIGMGRAHGSGSREGSSVGARV